MTYFGKLLTGLTLATALGVMVAPGVANAQRDRGWDRGDYRRHGEHEGWRRGGPYYAPAPAYYAPPVYYAPPPVYYAPRPYYAPGITLGIQIP